MSKFKDYLSRKSKLIRHPQVFQISHRPAEIVERKETYSLFKEVATFINYHVPINIIVRGLPGTGKTVTTQYVLDELKKEKPDIKSYYVNCSAKTDTDILGNLLQINEVGHLSSASLLPRFIKSIQSNVIIVLDDVDKTIGHSLSNMLYKLSKPNEVLPEIKFCISLIMISNDTSWPENLPAYVRSSLQPKHIYFRPYAREELARILRQRIREGLYNTSIVPEKALKRVVDRTYEERKSDSRVAITTLFNALKIAEMRGVDSITESITSNMFDDVVDEIDKNRLSRLSDNQLFILFSCLEAPEKTMKKIHEFYSSREEWPIKKLRFTQFFDTLRYLSAQSLIEASDTERRGFSIRTKVSRGSLFDEYRRRLSKLT